VTGNFKKHGEYFGLGIDAVGRVPYNLSSPEARMKGDVKRGAPV
jgi:hypothetical protein